MASESFREFRLRALFLSALVLIILFVLFFPNLVILFFASILVASVFTGMSAWLSSYFKIRYGIALLLVVLAVIAVVAGLGALVGIPFAAQVDQLWNSLSSAYRALTERMGDNRIIRQLAGELPIDADWIRSELSGPVLGVFTGTLGALANTVLILFTALYMAIDPSLYFRGLMALFPKQSRPRYESTLRSMGRSLRYWMLGRVLSMSVVGILTGVGLWLTGIPLVLALGVISGVLAFVPVIGPIVSSIPGLVLGFSQSSSTGLLVLLVYLVVQTLESYLITPIIDKHVVSLPPVLLLVAQAVFASFAGIAGVIFAAPLTLAIVILIQELYVRAKLGYRVEAIGKEPVDSK